MVRVLLLGLLLGVLSRVEEVADGFDVQISENATWLACACVAGAFAARLPDGALRGAAVLTAANAGYYAWILATEPGTPLASVAGPPLQWFALGIAAGAPLGAAASVTRIGAAVLLGVAVAGDALGVFAAILP